MCVVACVRQLYNDGRGGETNLVSFYTDNRVKFDRALEVHVCQGVCVCVCVCVSRSMRVRVRMRVRMRVHARMHAHTVT